MKILTAALLCCACTAAFAAPPTDASLEKLMRVQHIDDMWQDMSATIPDMAKQIIADNGRNAGHAGKRARKQKARLPKSPNNSCATPPPIPPRPSSEAV